MELTAKKSTKYRGKITRFHLHSILIYASTFVALFSHSLETCLQISRSSIRLFLFVSSNLVWLDIFDRHGLQHLEKMGLLVLKYSRLRVFHKPDI